MVFVPVLNHKDLNEAEVMEVYREHRENMMTVQPKFFKTLFEKLKQLDATQVKLTIFAMRHEYRQEPIAEEICYGGILRSGAEPMGLDGKEITISLDRSYKLFAFSCRYGVSVHVLVESDETDPQLYECITSERIDFY